MATFEQETTSLRKEAVTRRDGTGGAEARRASLRAETESMALGSVAPLLRAAIESKQRRRLEEALRQAQQRLGPMGLTERSRELRVATELLRGPSSAPSNTKGYSSTYLAMGFANVRAGTRYPPEHERIS